MQVTHANDRTGGSGHEPIVVSADESGAFTTPWFVDQDDSLGSILIGSAEQKELVNVLKQIAQENGGVMKIVGKEEF